MINRVFGWLFTLATLTVIVFAILNRGNYSSMCFDEKDEMEEVVEVVAIEENENEEPASEPLNVDDELEVVEASNAAEQAL